MALVRQDSQTVIQPSGGFAIGNYGMDKMMEAQGWKQLGDTFQTGFDLVKRDFDQDAVEQAQKDAPALIKRDGTSGAAGRQLRATRHHYQYLSRRLQERGLQSLFLRSRAGLPRLRVTSPCCGRRRP
jgi:uncharacterized protein (DUF849 family)